ncbi:hypothetical protein DT075_11255 [Bacillus licheniformis]|nr:hypothetical protein DT075_11255 [Bacillus licheniformis]
MGMPAYKTEEVKKNEKRKKEFPHIYVILAVMIGLMALATYSSGHFFNPLLQCQLSPLHADLSYDFT